MLELPNDFPTLRQKVIAMRRYSQNVMLLQFGLFLSVGLITMIMMNLIAFGDSTTPRNNSTTHQSIQKK